MKSISLQIFDIPDKQSEYVDKKKYRVFLFWERRINFTDRKKMLKFLAGASRELTYTMTEIAEISKDLFCVASDAFIAIDSWQGNEFGSFSTVFANLNRAYKSTGINSHVYIFKSLYDAIITLKGICERLIALYKSKNQFLQVRQLEIMLNRIIEVQKRIDRIGND